MFKTKLIVPLLLAICLGFVFACEKEPKNIIQDQPEVSTSADQADDRHDCCNVSFRGFQNNANGILTAYFDLAVFPGTQFRYIVTRTLTGQTYTTNWVTVGPGESCLYLLAPHPVATTVANQFGNCNGVYTVTCEIRSLDRNCQESALSKTITLGSVLCD